VELVDDLQIVDVAGVEDGIDALEGIEHLRPEFVAGFGDVCVGNETNSHVRSLNGPAAIWVRAAGRFPHPATVTDTLLDRIDWRKTVRIPVVSQFGASYG
jgi:hypothetical protein